MLSFEMTAVGGNILSRNRVLLYYHPQLVSEEGHISSWNGQGHFLLEIGTFFRKRSGIVF